MNSRLFQKYEDSLLYTLVLLPAIILPIVHYVTYEKKLALNYMIFTIIYAVLQFWIKNTLNGKHLQVIQTLLYYFIILVTPIFLDKMIYICLIFQIAGVIMLAFEKNIKVVFFLHAVVLVYNMWFFQSVENTFFLAVFVAGYGIMAYISFGIRTLIIKMLEKIEELSTTDDLTGLLNQKGFLKRIEEEHYRSQRYGKSFTLIMIDSDDLKRINDTHGHKYGNMVINMVAEVIRESVRRTDFAGRFGGDEYMICLVETALGNGIEFGERIRKMIEMKSLFTDKGKDFKVTISVGIANYPDSGKNLYEIIENADKALYMAKKDGKNKVKHVVIN